MPRIELRDPYGTAYRIDTRNVETTLWAWFDEVLPHIWLTAGDEVVWPSIIVWPMPSYHYAGGGMDWLYDSRVLGRIHTFRARTGDEGIAELVRLREQLTAELSKINRAGGVAKNQDQLSGGVAPNPCESPPEMP